MSARQTTRRSWIELTARAGYVARGLVFIIVGTFAGLAAIGARGHPAGSKDALATILREPFGEALLAALAVGLLCFAATAAGLIAFGLYGIAEAAYRRITPPPRLA